MAKFKKPIFYMLPPSAIFIQFYELCMKTGPNIVIFELPWGLALRPFDSK